MGIYPSQETYGIRFSILYEEDDMLKTHKLYELKYDELTNEIKQQIQQFYNTLLDYKIVTINEYFMSLAEKSITNNLMLVETLHKCSYSYELNLEDCYEWIQTNFTNFTELILLN
jgi:hypothetical protein